MVSCMTVNWIERSNYLSFFFYVRRNNLTRRFTSSSSSSSFSSSKGFSSRLMSIDAERTGCIDVVFARTNGFLSFKWLKIVSGSLKESFLRGLIEFSHSEAAETLEETVEPEIGFANVVGFVLTLAIVSFVQFFNISFRLIKISSHP